MVKQMPAEVAETFASIGVHMAASKDRDLDEMLAYRTELRRKIRDNYEYGDQERLDNLVEEIAETRRVLRDLWKEIERFRVISHPN